MANINQTPHFCVSGTWKNIMLNGDTVKIFHFLYWHVRSHSELQPKAMTCLIQLSTLSGSVFISGGADSKFSYYCNYLNFFLEMLKRCVSQVLIVKSSSLIALTMVFLALKFKNAKHLDFPL